MQLTVPIVGQEPGPNYAVDINNCFTLIDTHNHTPGKGVQVPTAGISIDANLSLNGFFIVSSSGIGLAALGSTPGNNTLYESGVDLYFVDGSGNNVRLTQGGAVLGNGITQLTGDVTSGPGVGPQAATIASNAVTTAKILNSNVTLAKIQNISTTTLLGRSTAGSGVVEQLSIGSGLTLAGGSLSANSVNALASDLSSSNSYTSADWSVTGASVVKTSTNNTNPIILGSTDLTSNSQASNDIYLISGRNNGSGGTGNILIAPGFPNGGTGGTVQMLGGGGATSVTLGDHRVEIQASTDAGAPALRMGASSGSVRIYHAFGGGTIQLAAGQAGPSAGPGNVSGVGTLSFSAASVGTVVLTVPSSIPGPNTWTMTLPDSAGSSSQFLQTNGSGVTSWAYPSAASGTFTTVDLKTVTVVNGIITSIV